jgi:uncharacterized protein (TIGR00369 family)
VNIPAKAPPFAELVGIEFVEAGEGRAVFALDAGPRHHNPMGTVHGGILCDLADAALGVAWVTLLAADETFTTLELKINFLRPVFESRLTAVGAVVKHGRHIGMAECEITDADDRLVAKASSTLMTLRGDLAAGR